MEHLSLVSLIYCDTVIINVIQDLFVCVCVCKSSRTDIWVLVLILLITMTFFNCSQEIQEFLEPFKAKKIEISENLDSGKTFSSADTWAIFCTKSSGPPSFSYQAPASWSQLPVSICHASFVSSFKSSLKTFLFSQPFSSVPFSLNKCGWVGVCNVCECIQVFVCLNLWHLSTCV